ncbi:hypothetical protein FB451DRAFT_1376550 [Mycena latifolia]|nr:hypothetical protein FB451DRAFT_1376550 [Mycena latifolia]
MNKRNVRVPSGASAHQVGLNKHLGDGSAFVNFNTRLSPSVRARPASSASCACSDGITSTRAALLAHSASGCTSEDSTHTHRTSPAILPPPPAPRQSYFAGGKWVVTCSSVRRRGNGASASGDSARIAPAPARPCAALPPQAHAAPRRPGLCGAQHPASPRVQARAAWHNNSATASTPTQTPREWPSGYAQHRWETGAEAGDERSEGAAYPCARKEAMALWADGEGGRKEGERGQRDEGSQRDVTIQSRGEGRTDGQLDSQRTARAGEDHPGRRTRKVVKGDAPVVPTEQPKRSVTTLPPPAPSLRVVRRGAKCFERRTEEAHADAGGAVVGSTAPFCASRGRLGEGGVRLPEWGRDNCKWDEVVVEQTTGLIPESPGIMWQCTSASFASIHPLSPPQPVIQGPHKLVCHRGADSILIIPPLIGPIATLPGSRQQTRRELAASASASKQHKYPDISGHAR